MKTGTLLIPLVLLAWSYPQQPIDITLQSVRISDGIKQKQISFQIEIMNRTDKPVMLFPIEPGRYLSVYRTVFIAEGDTLWMRQLSDVDWYCYPADTLRPRQTVKRTLVVDSYSAHCPQRKIHTLEDFLKLHLDQAALEYRMTERFDTIQAGPDYRNCQSYDSISLRTRFVPVERRRLRPSSSRH